MLCKICSNKAEKRFEAVILAKYTGSYYQCPSCQFLHIDNPVWLEEAYNESINLCDAGILARNIRLRELASIIIYYFFNHSGQFVDYAGGYGIFTRLMRDIGFDYYWSDKYSENVLAKGFEYKDNIEIELQTAFEVLEHLETPLQDLTSMLSISRNILFSTDLLPTPLPTPDQWWYYGTEHGQHISFYTKRTLRYIADNFGLNYYNFRNLHLFTDKPINENKFYLITRFYKKLFLFRYLQKNMKSRTMSDLYYINSLTNLNG